MARRSPVLRRLVCLFLTLSLLPLVFPAPPAAANDEARWLRVNIPQEGTAGGWVLAAGSDILGLVMAGDGALYAAVDGLDYTLLRSTDGGRTWAATGGVQDDIVAIAVVPGAPQLLYYATKSAVFYSADAGRTFSALPAGPGGAGAGNIEITSLAAGRLEANVVLAGTRDTDEGQFGGVYRLDQGEVIPAWRDLGAGDYDVYAVALSPGYALDRQVVAVATDEAETFVVNRFADLPWNDRVGRARLAQDNAGDPVPLAVSAAIAFPADYSSELDGSYVQFVAVDTGTGEGDVYKITGAAAPGQSTAVDLDIGGGYGLDNVDVTGLAVLGQAAHASLLAGSADGVQTYFSADGGATFKRSRKAPTGGARTVVLAGDGDELYAATSGAGSALSVSGTRA